MYDVNYEFSVFLILFFEIEKTKVYVLSKGYFNKD